MVKHIVMWNVRGTNSEEKRQAALDLKAKFEGLLGHVPGLRHIEVGLDVSGASYACDVVLYSEFEDEQSLRAYAEHPAHLAVRKELVDVRVARYQVDYAISGAI